MTAARGAVAPAYRSSRSARIVDYAVILRLAYRTADPARPHLGPWSRSVTCGPSLGGCGGQIPRAAERIVRPGSLATGGSGDRPVGGTSGCPLRSQQCGSWRPCGARRVRHCRCGHRLGASAGGAAGPAVARAVSSPLRGADRRRVLLGAGSQCLEHPPAGARAGGDRGRRRRFRHRLRRSRAQPGAGHHDRVAAGAPDHRRVRLPGRRPFRRAAAGLLRISLRRDGGTGTRATR